MGQRSGDERAAAELETGSSSGMEPEETWDLNLLILIKIPLYDLRIYACLCYRFN